VSAALWSEVDAYIAGLLVEEDDALRAAADANAAAELPPIAVSPSQGKLLALLVRIQGARSVLELGTLGGYSTIWLARALPAGGRLVTLELDARYAELARANIERADFIFIDADKPNTPEYFQRSLELSRPGSVILTDNVVRAGAIIDASSDDPRAQGMRRFHELLPTLSGFTATTIQTVGSKGYDGFTLALVTA
jgi:predicted O-methyltransferase YrrM